MSKINTTYAMTDHQIHGQHSDSHLTICGEYVSDIKPMGPGAITCPDCSVMASVTEAYPGLADLGRALRASGITVVRE